MSEIAIAPVYSKKSVHNAWALFDSANSVHALVITAAIFPAYFLKVTDETLRFAGISMYNSTLYAFCISAAFLVMAALSPLLSGISDYGGRRKAFLKFFTYLGSISCMLLFFFDGMPTLYLGVFAFIFSVIGFTGGLVFYNSYLPLISEEEEYDRLSARGFAFGYIGSVILLILILAAIINPHWVGLDDVGLVTRFGFLLVGIWWMALAQIPFRYLPKDKKSHFTPKALKMGYYKIIKVWKELKKLRNVRTYLMAFFCYSLGVQTTIMLAATFAETEMAFETSELILLILIIQLVAVVGAYLFALVSGWKGNKFSLIFQLILWVTVCILAYFVDTKINFYLVAGLVGLVLGGIQSLSRSSYAKLIAGHAKESTSYFSFYDVLEKMGVVLGTFCFGLVSQLTSSMRTSTLVLALFFVIGIIILTKVDFSHSRNTAHSTNS